MCRREWNGSQVMVGLNTEGGMNKANAYDRAQEMRRKVDKFERKNGAYWWLVVFLGVRHLGEASPRHCLCF